MAMLAGAAATIVSGILASKAQGKATKAQERANQQAMAFQREQARRAEQMHRQQWEMWNASRKELLRRYGIDIPMPGGEGPGLPPGAVPRAPGVGHYAQMPRGVRERMR